MKSQTIFWSAALSLTASACVPVDTQENHSNGQEIVGGAPALAGSAAARSTAALAHIDDTKEECSRYENAPDAIHLEVPPASCLTSFCSSAVVTQRTLVSAAHCIGSGRDPRVTLKTDIEKENRRRARATYDRVFALFGTDVKSPEAIVEVEWMIARSAFPGIVAREAIIEDDLDEDYFSEWSIKPLTMSRDSQMKWSRQRDIALISLKADMPQSSVAVRLGAESVIPGAEVIVAGYGLDKAQLEQTSIEPPPVQGTSGILRATSYVVRKASTCSSATLQGKGKNTSGACSGDSGGPVLRMDGDNAPVLVGLVSQGDCVGSSPDFGFLHMVDPRHHFE